MKDKIKEKCRQVKIILTDVDCVLTDGSMYYSNKGDIMKKFHTRDGMGITLLRKNGIPTIIVTKEKTEIVRQWAKKMKIKKVYDGILKKEEIVKIICKQYEVAPNELAYIGDDVNDIELLKKVGLGATPADGVDKVKRISNYVCKTKGGSGAFREFADLILSHANGKK